MQEMSKFDIAKRRNPHLARYIDEFTAKTDEIPTFHESLSRSMRDLEKINIIYPVGDPIFIHIYGTYESKKYIVIEPTFTEEQEEKLNILVDRIFELSADEPPCDTKEKLERTITNLLDKNVEIISSIEETKKGRWLSKSGKKKKFGKKVPLTEMEYEYIKYHIKKNLVETGILEPLIRDPYLEDIHCTGWRSPIAVLHKVFGSIETNLRFRNPRELDDFVDMLGQKTGKPATTAHPIVDVAMPDGSRLNVIYASDVSVHGPSFTIRKFSAEPLSVTQIVDWNTYSAEMAAYMWLCLESGVNLFICGEIGSGKTSTLNAIMPFIPYNSKIYSVEDTAELFASHRVWQELLTRDTGIEETTVDTQKLLRAGFRSRPDYIIVGEIRGPEGNIAFQAMQAGRPVLSTFHADTISRLVQRFTGDPINVPIRFLTNLHAVLIQKSLYIQGRMHRRAVGLFEILGYSSEANTLITSGVFTWDAATDSYYFRGLNNSYVLEEVIAPKFGFADKRKIYDELALRTKIIDAMVKYRILSYHEVVDVIRAFQNYGVKGLPFYI